jgi:outer membrane biosynthesis protein TonB
MQLQDNSIDLYLKRSRRDKSISININRNTLIAFIVSILIHSLLLWVALPKLDMSNPFPKSDTIEVTLAPPPKAIEPTKDIPPPPSPKVEEVAPKVITKKPVAKPSKPKPQDFSVPKEMTKPEPSPLKVPEMEPIPPRPTPPDNAPVDMMALVNQNRARRQATESDAARINAQAEAAERGPTLEERRNQRIMENLKTGTNGIFEIKRIDALGGSFSFRGWTNDYNNSTMQYFDIPAKAGQDTRLLMVKRMISLIREHYQGDFTWESRRLARSVTLSAKLEDNAGLEDFLMTEFFGPNYKSQ